MLGPYDRLLTTLERESFVKRFFAACCATLLLAGLAASPVQAQSKPIVIVAFSSLDEMLDDGQYIADLAAPGQAPPLRAVSGGFLQGIDTTRPWGASFSLDETSQPQVFGFLPVTDVDSVLNTISQTASGELEEVEPGIQSLSIAGQKVVVKESGGYAYITQMAAQLKGNLPNPATVLGDLPKTYDMAVALNVQNIPVFLRQLAFSTVSQAMESSLEKLPGETDADFQARRDMARGQIKELERVINETETMTFGFSIDKSNRQLFMDVALKPVPNSKMAQQTAALVDSATSFGSLVDQSAAALMSIAQQITDQQQIATQTTQIKTIKQQLLTMIEETDEFRNEDERELAKEATDEGFDLLVGLVESGKLDFAMNIQQDATGRFVLTGGMYLPQAKRAEALAKKLLTVAAQAEPDFPKAKFDIETHGGVTLHSLPLPNPPRAKAREAMDTLIGLDSAAYLGFGEDTVWFTVGSDVVTGLKSAIDAYAQGQPQPVPPSYLKVSLLPFLEAAGQLEPKAAEAADQLTATSDTIEIVSKANADGSAQTRISIQEGIIKLIGFAAQQANQGDREEFDDTEF